MPPSICPTTDSGFSARPTSCAVAIWTTRTRPSSTSTSTTARWATNANATWHAPWPRSSSSSVARWRYVTVSSKAARRRVGHRHALAAHGVDDVGAFDRQPHRVDTDAGGDVLEEALAHRPARHVGRAARHPGLARRRRRPRRPDRGVGRLEHDFVDAEDVAGDLRGDRHEPLTDLGGRELERHGAVGEPAAGGRRSRRTPRST